MKTFVSFNTSGGVNCETLIKEAHNSIVTCLLSLRFKGGYTF